MSIGGTEGGDVMPHATKRGKKVLIHMTYSLIKALDRAATELDRSRSDAVREAVRQWIERHSERRSDLKEAGLLIDEDYDDEEEYDDDE